MGCALVRGRLISLARGEDTAYLELFKVEERYLASQEKLLT